MHAHLTLLMAEYDIPVPQLPDIDLTRVETEWKRLRSTIPEVWKFNNDGREFQAGENMKARGLDAVYPVVLIPGVVSTVCDGSDIRESTDHLLYLLHRVSNHGPPLLIIAPSFARKYGVDST